MKRVFTLGVLVIILLSGCRADIKDDRVRQESERSLEIALDYIKQQRELHEFDLTRKIRMANDKIKRRQGQIGIGNKTDAALLELQYEKANLEKKLNVLIANTDASTKHIKEKWGKYNQSLDAMLGNMEDYLKGIPIDTDTLPKKDSLPAK